MCLISISHICIHLIQCFVSPGCTLNIMMEFMEYSLKVSMIKVTSCYKDIVRVCNQVVVNVVMKLC